MDSYTKELHKNHNDSVDKLNENFEFINDLKSAINDLKETGYVHFAFNRILDDFERKVVQGLGFKVGEMNGFTTIKIDSADRIMRNLNLMSTKITI